MIRCLLLLRLMLKGLDNSINRSQLDAWKKITVKYVFEYLNSCLTDDMIVLADVGDALFAGADLIIRGIQGFFHQTYYASLGFAVPASIGAQLADRTLRPLVIVGDGAFQMTGMGCRLPLDMALNPIVVVLNNGIYLTEQLMLEGAFNNLQPWNYSNIPRTYWWWARFSHRD